MDPRLRQTLVVTISALLAVWLGWKIAESSYFWPGLFGFVATSAILVRLFHLPMDVILFGWLLLGYIVGNRGFAQLMPAPGLPLLPAESVLLLAGGWRIIAGAFERRLPFRKDPLNWAVLLWVIAGSARLVFDFPRFGFAAIRDFALVYYAVFFFLAQEMSREVAARRFLLGTVVVACVLLGPVFALYSAAPDFFLRHLTVHGAPVVYYKGDLLFTSLAIGSLLIFFCAPARWRPWPAVVSGLLFISVAGGDNRASLAGLLVATTGLMLARRWSFPAWQLSIASLGLILVLGLAMIGNNSWAERKLAGISDRARSVTDFAGTGLYRSEGSFNKGDNNRFRLIWWRNVIEQTWAGNPVFGLGFGEDLAGAFLREYYPDADDEFSARSPHNVFLTVFGRMGAVGLAVWVLLCLQLVRGAWHTLRRQPDPPGWALWCSLAVLLTSATFGVVLEGPMGAVPFWILLGVAHARSVEHDRAAAAAATIDGTETGSNSSAGALASPADKTAPAVTG